MYLAVLSHDDEAKANVESTFANWKKSKLSSKQRDLIEEYESIIPPLSSNRFYIHPPLSTFAPTHPHS